MHERILFMFRLETSVIDRPAVWSDYRSIWIQKPSHVHLKDTESEVIQSFSRGVVAEALLHTKTPLIHHWSHYLRAPGGKALFQAGVTTLYFEKQNCKVIISLACICTVVVTFKCYHCMQRMLQNSVFRS